MRKQVLSLAVASLVCASFAQAKFYVGIEGGYTGGARDTKQKNYEINAENSSYFLIPGGSTLGNTFKDKTYMSTDGSSEVEPWKGFNIAINLGSEHFFASNYLGVRWGASVGFTEIMQDWTEKSNRGNCSYTDTRAYIDTGLSFDLMINFVARPNFSFGVFGGIEGDYHYLVINDHEDITNNKVHNFLSDSELTPSRHSMDLAGRVGLSTLMGKHHRIDLTAKLPIGYVVAGSDNKVKIDSDIVKTSFNVGYKYIF